MFSLFRLNLLFFTSFCFKSSSHALQVLKDCACGEANVPNGRIVNGYETEANKYPWMVAMYLPPKDTFTCGGSIISDMNILTAAHCVFYLPNIAQSYWHLGMHQKGNTALERYGIDSYELHPRFVNSSGYDDFDLAIVTLNKRIQFNRNMKPICLPSGAGNYFGKLTTVAGWGRLSDAKRAKSAKALMATKVVVKTDKECTKMTSYLIDYNPESMVCAYGYKTDACQGDSGGPLFIETHTNRHEIIGTVSFGEGCATKFPGIYGKVATSQTLGWINGYIDRTSGAVCDDPLNSKKLLRSLMPFNSVYDNHYVPLRPAVSPMYVG